VGFLGISTVNHLALVPKRFLNEPLRTSLPVTYWKINHLEVEPMAGIVSSSPDLELILLGIYGDSRECFHPEKLIFRNGLCPILCPIKNGRTSSIGLL
jgi:hypothetical protein